jgi:hypothetical protein
MPLCAADIRILSLVIQRLMDAELLLDAEGAALLAQVEAVRRSLDEGNEADAERCATQFVRSLETLVRSGRLEGADGRRALEVARRTVRQAGADPGAVRPEPRVSHDHR